MLYSVVFRSTVVLSGFAIFLISSYLYGPEGRGAISFLMAFYLTLSLAVSLGLGRVAYQRISQSSQTASMYIHTLVRYIYLVSAIIFIIVLLLHLILNQTDLKMDVPTKYFVLAFACFPYYIWLNFNNFLFGAVQKTKAHDILIFKTRLGQVLLMSTLLLFKLSLSFFLFLFGISGFLIFLVEYKWLLHPLNDGPAPSMTQTVETFLSTLKDFKWPYIDSIAQTIAPFSVFILGLFVSQADLGHYNFALQLISALGLPIYVFQIKLQEMLVVPHEDGGELLIRKSFLLIIPICLIFILLGYGIPLLIPYVGLSKFTASMPMFKALLWTLPFAGAYTVFQSIWVGKHKAQWSSLINLFTGAINILLVFSLASSQGVYAGIIGTYSAILVGLVLQTYVLRTNWQQITTDRNSTAAEK